MNKDDKFKTTSRLWFSFVLILMALLIAIMFLAALVVIVFYQNGWLISGGTYLPLPMVGIILVSAVLGAGVTYFVGKKILTPINDLSNALRKVAKGNFSVRLNDDVRLAEIAEMNRNFNQMVRELSGTETLRNDFVVNVSHEFKTPLAAIEGYATLLQNPSLSPEKHDEYAEKVITNVRRLTTLTGNMLQLSKLENQGMPPEKKFFSLDEQIRKSVLMLESQWESKNIAFDIDLDSVEYYGDEGIIFQIWNNLIGNAIKFSKQDGSIRLVMRKLNGKITVQVADNGCGISETAQKHIFDKFYQGDNTHSSEGNGLGLSLVKKIVTLSGGNISVTSKLGEGTVFTVELPRRTGKN